MLHREPDATQGAFVEQPADQRDAVRHAARRIELRQRMMGVGSPVAASFRNFNEAGTVVGEHSVIFAGPAERIELVHRAEDRMIFARGALHAALWAKGQKPGLYSMADVLGLKDF